jgi:hypothetical protein
MDVLIQRASTAEGLQSLSSEELYQVLDELDSTRANPVLRSRVQARLDQVIAVMVERKKKVDALAMRPVSTYTLEEARFMRDEVEEARRNRKPWAKLDPGQARFEYDVMQQVAKLEAEVQQLAALNVEQESARQRAEADRQAAEAQMIALAEERKRQEAQMQAEAQAIRERAEADRREQMAALAQAREEQQARLRAEEQAVKERAEADRKAHEEHLAALEAEKKRLMIADQQQESARRTRKTLLYSAVVVAAVYYVTSRD